MQIVSRCGCLRSCDDNGRSMLKEPEGMGTGIFVQGSLRRKCLPPNLPGCLQ
jgi:hypothetical protein